MVASIAPAVSCDTPSSGRAVFSLKAPATGDVLQFAQLTDLALNAGLMGAGAAVMMTTGEVVAPLPGVVDSINIAKAQLTLIHPKGLKLLLQIGQPGEICFGERIQWLVKQGQQCSAGQPLLQSDPLWIKQQGATPACITTILNGNKLGAIVLTQDPKVRVNDDHFLTLYV